MNMMVCNNVRILTSTDTNFIWFLLVTESVSLVWQSSGRRFGSAYVIFLE